MGKSDVGKAREMNQDSFYVSEENDKIKLFILADGMGGYKGGEIASKLAVVSAKNFITNNFEKIPKETEEILKLISDAIEYANFIVYEKAKEIPEISDMGTTLDICLVYNNKVFIGHIGDSRVYRIRKNVIRKLTNDHSYVAQLVKEGKITKETPTAGTIIYNNGTLIMNGNEAVVKQMEPIDDTVGESVVEITDEEKQNQSEVDVEVFDPALLSELTKRSEAADLLDSYDIAWSGLREDTNFEDIEEVDDPNEKVCKPGEY